MAVAAFVGSRELRKLEPKRVNLFMDRARELAREGWDLSTGGAEGADLTAASIFLEEGRRVTLYLPWASFNRDLISELPSSPSLVVFSKTLHPEALESVRDLHPYYSNLSEGAKCLHARNYLIVTNSSRVVLIPTQERVDLNKLRQSPGGTLQALRVAISTNLPYELV